MSYSDFPQIIELADGTKCVRLEDFLKNEGYKELFDVAKSKIERLRSERDEARRALQSVMDWNPKPTSCAACWTALPARFNADMARAWKILEATK